MEKEKLFQEFSSVTIDEWKEKIIKDLKGADYDRKLVWKTNNGFDLKPFYRNEDLKNLDYLNTLPGDFPFTRGNNAISKGWKVNQVIEVDSIEKANKKALEIRMKGVDSLTFNFKPKLRPSEKDIENLLENLRIDIIEVNFRCDFPSELIKIIDNLARKYNRNLDEIKGSVFCDPISVASVGGNVSKENIFSELENCLIKVNHLSNFHCLTIDGSIFHNSGSSTVSELAFTLAIAVEYLNHLTKKGFDIDNITPHIRFTFATGSSYFTEIAKFRALRYLWAKIVNEYGISESKFAQTYIHAVSSLRNKTIYDPYVNMLRTTTESMSAALGGADSITVLPFDIAKGENSELGIRIARNQQLLLKGESHFDKVNDTVAGSYYIENITNELIEKSWELFLQVDEKGGYLKSFENGFVTERIESEAAKLKTDIDTRRKSVLGTNQYPNNIEFINNFKNEVKVTDNKLALKPFRNSLDFENLRLRTDIFSQNSPRPKVWMFTYGNLTMRKARAQFSANFFGCAGYETMDNLGFETVDAGIEAAKTENPDIVVICSSDEEYKEIVLPIFKALKDKSIIVLAGYPKDIIEELKSNGFTNFVHVKTNALEELMRYQDELGVV